MVYMGTFAAQSTSGVTLTKSMFTITGGGNPDNLTTWMSKGYTFKVTGSGYFGTIAVEPGDMIIVNKDSPGTTVSYYDIIQMNLTNYVTTFGGVSGDIGVRGVNGVAESATVGAVNFTLSSGVLAGTVVRDTPVVTWTGGTTNGPTLKVKAMGNTSTAVAVPSASASASGVVTTDTQTFAGAKTFTHDLTIGAGKKLFFAHGVNNLTIPFFEIKNIGTDQAPVYALHTNVGLYSDSFITAYGVNGSSGGGVGGHNMVTWTELQSYSEPATDEAEAEDVASAWAVKKLYDTCVRSVGTPTADNNPQYVVTGITKNANSSSLGFSRAPIYYNKVSLNGTATSIVTASSTTIGIYAPTTAGTAGQVFVSNGSSATWGYADRLKLVSADSLSSLNTPSPAPGLYVYNFSLSGESGVGLPPGVGAGTMLQMSRATNYTGGSVGVNTEFQILSTSISGDNFWLRNTAKQGAKITDADFGQWYRVLTVGEDGSCSFIHSYPIGSGQSSYTTGYIFNTTNLVAALYDNNNNQVIADVQIVLYNGSSSTYAGKYAVKVSFATNTAASYRLVVYGV